MGVPSSSSASDIFFSLCEEGQIGERSDMPRARRRFGQRDPVLPGDERIADMVGQGSKGLGQDRLSEHLVGDGAAEPFDHLFRNALDTSMLDGGTLAERWEEHT